MLYVQIGTAGAPKNLVDLNRWMRIFRRRRDPTGVSHNPETMPSSSANVDTLRVNDRDVVITNPGKVLFPQAGYTKLDVVNYYLAVADGALRGAARAIVPISSFAIPTASARNSFSRSARLKITRRGSRWF